MTHPTTRTAIDRFMTELRKERARLKNERRKETQ